MPSSIQIAIAYVAETKEIAAVLLTALLSAAGFITLRIMAAKPKLLYAVLDQSHLLPKDNEGKTFSVFTMKALFVNAGRKMCDSVEFSLNYAPQHFEMFPHLPYTTHKNPDGRVIYTIANLNPKESFNISMLNSYSSLPEITGVRYKGGSARLIEVEPSRKFSKLTRGVVGTLLITGSISILYAAVRIIQTLIA